MTHLSLGVMGSFQASLAEAPLTTFESDKVRALLIFLAVESDRPHRREELVGLLWPDYPEESARHSLRQALSNLRQVIQDRTAAPPYLLISREAIQFNPASDYSLDLAQFNQYFSIFDQGQSQGLQDDPLDVARQEEMVKLYRGEFLSQFFLEDSAEFEEWGLVQRERLHQRILEVLSSLADFYEQRMDYQAARRILSRQLELDPWREEAHRQMMRALALDDRRSAALQQYETCRRILAEELDIEPSVETRELYEQIRLGTFHKKPEPISYLPTAAVINLPTQLTAFIGREAELAQLSRLIGDAECRCITMVGPGGVGKTRLALEVARNHTNEFAQGVVFVPLASIGSTAAIIPEIAAAINLAAYHPIETKEQLLNYLREKQILLILDNIEHLLANKSIQAGTIDLLIEILKDATAVKLLVTSREALNLQGEWLFEVQGLAYPRADQTEDFDALSSVILFVQRARRVVPGFSLNAENRSEIARICRMVEGMPLAIELAATWVRTLSPGEIAGEIEHNLDFLSAPLRDLPERHRSMRVVFDYSWQMLSADERLVLCKLSIFRGGLTRQAAEQVAGASLMILSTLVNRTLLRRTADGRYELHELVRQYSNAHLAADPHILEATQQQHYAYYLALADTAAQGLKGRSQSHWLTLLEKEHDNLRVALDWSLEGDETGSVDNERALRLSGALRWFWWMHGHFNEGLKWYTEALQRSPKKPTSARASALLGMSLLLNGLGDLDAARAPAEESEAIYRELGDRQGLAEALTIYGRMSVWQGEASTGCSQLREALGIYRQAGDRWGEAQALFRLGVSLVDYLGDLDGRAMLEDCAAIMEDLGERYLFDSFMISLGIVDMGFGDYDAAQASFERSLAVAREINHPWGIADALTNLGCVYRILGKYSIAQTHLEEAHRVYQEHGRTTWEIDVLCALAENAIAQGDLSAARSYLQPASTMLKIPQNKWLQTLVGYFQGLLAFYEGNVEEASVGLTETIALARAGQYQPDLARALVTLGRVKLTQGEIASATGLLLEGLELYRKLGHKLGIAIAFEVLAAVRTVQDDCLQAVMLFSAADALREEMKAPIQSIDQANYTDAVTACRTRLGEAEFLEAWAQARTRSYLEVADDLMRS